MVKVAPAFGPGWRFRSEGGKAVNFLSRQPIGLETGLVERPDDGFLGHNEGQSLIGRRLSMAGTACSVGGVGAEHVRQRNNYLGWRAVAA